MNLNSQYELYPPQPDNPADEDRHTLMRYTLSRLGWVQDMPSILKLTAPPQPVTDITPPGSLRGLRVGILGGGLAGLSAAYELRKTGCDITVFDALTDRVGGRVYTYYFEGTALYGEFGAMRIPVSHETVWHYLKEFKLPTRPFIQFNPHAFIYLEDTRVRNDRDGANVRTHIYPKYQLAGWEQKKSWQELLATGTDNQLLRATMRDRLEIIEIRRHYTVKALEWINRTNLKIMESSGLTQSAINLTTNFMPLLNGNLYNSFVDYIQEVYPASLSYLYEIPGGLSRLPYSFYQSFFSDGPYPSIPTADTGSVRYNAGCLVTGLRLEDGGRRVAVRYRDLTTGAAADSSFDYVVCAIPFSTLRSVELDPLFSNLKMRAIREVYYTPAQKTILYCTERFWEKQGIVGGGSFTDLPVRSVWYPSDHARFLTGPGNVLEDTENIDTGGPGVIIGSYNFALDTTRLYNQYEPIFFDSMKRDLAAVHGLPEDYINRVVTDFRAVNWNQEPTFRGALCFFAPEQKRLFAYNMTLPEYGGRVFFAGEHISGLHRWLQGALQTGMQAANDLARTAAVKEKNGWSS